jgi:hypothetical protein
MDLLKCPEAQTNRSLHIQPAPVCLDSSVPHNDGLNPLTKRFSLDEFEFAHFVASEGQSGHIVTLDEEFRSSKVVRGEARRSLGIFERCMDILLIERPRSRVRRPRRHCPWRSFPACVCLERLPIREERG